MVALGKVMIECVDNNADVRCDCAEVDNCELDSQQTGLSERDSVSENVWKVYCNLRELCNFWPLGNLNRIDNQQPTVDTSIPFRKH